MVLEHVPWTSSFPINSRHIKWEDTVKPTLGGILLTGAVSTHLMESTSTHRTGSMSTRLAFAAQPALRIMDEERVGSPRNNP
jgi:hypothetical protein